MTEIRITHAGGRGRTPGSRVTPRRGRNASWWPAGGTGWPARWPVGVGRRSRASNLADPRSCGHCGCTKLHGDGFRERVLLGEVAVRSSCEVTPVGLSERAGVRPAESPPLTLMAHSSTPGPSCQRRCHPRSLGPSQSPVLEKSRARRLQRSRPRRLQRGRPRRKMPPRL